eukprot:13201603-Alexandrium_andersonii.AAC.1
MDRTSAQRCDVNAGRKLSRRPATASLSNRLMEFERKTELDASTLTSVASCCREIRNCKALRE